MNKQFKKLLEDIKDNKEIKLHNINCSIRHGMSSYEIIFNEINKNEQNKNNFSNYATTINKYGKCIQCKGRKSIK